ncbi:carboxymuconolactone decarboxylase family protein [uncultured Desulfosarcina sp.]|uniref:carboxymuconolactone decarboxylase family protein n=1 Tax=uncultured Desulfosarcina sp. TaxID=218289 RepID=UPI0029C8A753|nr:carboxymuconolactone decarboxylase family protein [uncultured Desulfosarcina sp.]
MEKELTPRQEEIKDKFINLRGYWKEAAFGDLLRMDPDYFEAYMNFSSKPWIKGVLAPKIKELIYIAIDTSCTHLHAKGTRVHIKNALKYGATKEEIMEVFELVSILGIHSVTMGLPILVEELKELNQEI